MKTNYLALAVNLLFATAFTISCTSSDGGDMFYGCIKGTCVVSKSSGTLQNSNMTFVNSPIPSGQASYISNVQFNGSAVAGGSSSITFTSSEMLNELYLQIAGEGGYYVLELSEDNIVSWDEYYVYSVPLQFSQQLENGELGFTVSGSTREDAVSASTTGSVQIIKAGTGALQITLSWDKYDDLDLHVYTPSENELYYGYRLVPATEKVGKAELDIDSNPGCSIDRRNTENVYFESPLEDGVYSISVCLFSKCSQGAGARYNVSANSKGNPIANKSGKFADSAREGCVGIGTISVRNGAVVQGNDWSSSSVRDGVSSSSVVRSSSSIADYVSSSSVRGGVSSSSVGLSSSSLGGGVSSSSVGGVSSSSNGAGQSSSSVSDLLLWDLSMGTEVQTGGKWFNYCDKYGEEGGKSISLFYDRTSNDYVNYTPLNYPNTVDEMDWSGEVSFHLDPSGYEFAYASVSFAWGATITTPAPEVWGKHTGLCVEYSLSPNGGGDYYLIISTNDYTEYNEYKAILPKQAMGKKFFDFGKDFSQERGWGNIITLLEAKNNSVGMVFEGRAHAANYTRVQEGTLEIKSIYWDTCN